MLGNLISAGTSLLGGLLGSSSADRAQKTAKNQQRKALQQSRRDQKLNMAFQEKWARKNIALQKEFAQSGIRWKVKDAQAAGVHPLYALGANTNSFGPVTVGGVPDSNFLPVGASNSGDIMGRALADAGQDIGRAVSAMKTPQEKMQDVLTLQNMGLQNDYLRVQIASTYARTGTGPGLPGNSGPYTMFGQKIYPSENWSNAQDLADRYGEPAEWLSFPFIAGSDLRKTFIANFGRTPESYYPTTKFDRGGDPHRYTYFTR